MKKYTINNAWFAIVQVLIWILIFAWMSVVAYQAAMWAIEKGRDSERVADLWLIESDLSWFSSKYWAYPWSNCDWRKYPSSCDWVTNGETLKECLFSVWKIEDVIWITDDSELSESVQKYIDPKEWNKDKNDITFRYEYVPNDTCTWYKLWAISEAWDWLWVDWEEVTDKSATKFIQKASDKFSVKDFVLSFD